MEESILTDWDELFDITGAWVPETGPDHQVIYVCRGCRLWQADKSVDDLDALSDVEELAEQHLDECEPLSRAVDLNRWWSAVATRDRTSSEIWIGDLLDRLRPLAEWHHVPDLGAPVATIVACRSCSWQADAPSVARYDEWACLYAFNEHRHECAATDVMAALLI